MVNGNADANNAKECLDRCNNDVNCMFWDYGDGYCRLRSDSGNGPTAYSGYEYGTKGCSYGKYDNELQLTFRSLDYILILFFVLI